MAIDNKNLSNGNNNSNSPSYSKDNFKTNKQSTFDMFDINVKQAQKDISTVFGSAKSSFSDYERSTKRSIDNIFNKATSSMKSFEKMQMASTGRIVSDTISQYNRMYSQLSKMQSDFTNGMYQNHKNTYDKVSKMWESGINSDVNVNVKNNSISSSNSDKNSNISNRDTDKLLTGLKDIANTITSTLISKFKSGVDRIVNTYEDTYQSVSVRLGYNQTSYQQYQLETVDAIKSLELTDNLALSDVMKKLDEVSKLGLNQEDAKNKALSDSITNVIAPYLETQSSAYTDLQLKLGDQFTQNVAGMSSYLMDIAGSNRVFKDSINDVVTKLEPIQLYAQKQMMSGEEYAKVEALVDSGIMTQSQAVKYISEAADAVSNPYEALTSGSTAQRVMVATGQNKDLNSYIEGSAQYYQNMYGSINDSTGLSQGAAISATGDNNVLSSWTDVNKLLNTVSSIKDSDKSTIDYYNEQFAKFQDGQYNTQKQKNDITAENYSTVAAIVKEKFPYTTEILEKISSQMTALITTTAANGVTNLLSNKNSGISNLSDTAENLSKTVETFGENGKIQKTFSSLDKIGDLAKTTKSGLSNFGSKAITTLGKSGVGSTATNLVGGASLITGAIMTIKDAVGGIKKSEDWLGDNSIKSKISSAIGGAIGGTGKGIGEKGATVGDVAKNTGSNALKGAAIGAGIGSFIPGVGTAIGGAVGAGVGAITGLIGGERIAKAADKLGDMLSSGIKKSIELNPITNVISKQFGHVVDNSKQAFSELKSIWGDEDKSFAEKIGGTFGTVTQTIKDNFTDVGKSVKETISDMKENWDSFTHAFTKEGAQENIDNIKNWASGVKDSVTGFFKDLGSGYTNSQENIKESNKESQIDASTAVDGSHASGLDSVPYDGYIAKLHKGESIFNKDASTTIKNVLGVTATSVGRTLSSTSPLSLINKTLSGSIGGSDNSDVVEAIQIATSKLIEAITSSSSNSKNEKLTDNRNNLLPMVNRISQNSTNSPLSAITSLQSTMPTAKGS